MAEKTFDHDWMALQFHSHEKTLELTWKEATGDMGGEGFQMALAMYGAEAMRLGAEGLLVDTRAFRFGDFAAVEEWRQAAVIPLYHHAGVRRFAYVFPEAFELPPERAPGDGENFTTRYFHSPAEARSWLSG